MSASVFPARAGMSPFFAESVGEKSGVPRASGDEPLTGLLALCYDWCSPRERG